MSRPRIFIDREKFEHLLTIQCTKQDICQHFRCSHDTVEAWCKRTYKRTFSDVADDFHADGRVSLRRIQYSMAENGNVQMAIHLGKQWLGQTDKTESKVQADMNIKHGAVTRVILYDPVTGNPTQETLEGADDDIRAYLRDHDNYNGDTSTFRLPEKDIDPDELENMNPAEMSKFGISGEKTIVSPDGKVRAHFPYNGRDRLPIELIVKHDNGLKAVLEDYDDGRGGLVPDIAHDHLPIRHTVRQDNGDIAVIEFPDDGRGGYTS